MVSETAMASAHHRHHLQHTEIDCRHYLHHGIKDHLPNQAITEVCIIVRPFILLTPAVCGVTAIYHGVIIIVEGRILDKNVYHTFSSSFRSNTNIDGFIIRR
mmetsp:Transcript_36628/g.88288  ORF Transcript_36628/g.88288 Transcript_36628/m.88288 type:complete len:102 (-) Transcript_36628:116-421(-)